MGSMENLHDSNRNNKDRKRRDGKRTPSVKVRDIPWLRVKSTNQSGEIEYYFWNKVTNETSWDAPKHWKEYEDDVRVEVNAGIAVSDMDYRQTMQATTSQNDDVFATKELLKLAEEMKEESMENLHDSNRNNKERKRRDGKRRHSSSSNHKKREYFEYENDKR